MSAQRPLCPRCGVRWVQVGDRTGHCAGKDCHRTFSSEDSFDRHLSVDPATGRSIHHDPELMLTAGGNPVFSSSVDAAGALVWKRWDSRSHWGPRQSRQRVPAPREAHQQTSETTGTPEVTE